MLPAPACCMHVIHGCQSGSMAGLVERLLLLEVLPAPLMGRSLLAPALAPAWSQQLLQLLANAAATGEPASPLLQRVGTSSGSSSADVAAACSSMGLVARCATAAWVNTWHGLMRARGSDYSSCEAR